MGNFIEALEEGANTLFQTGTGCRYGYYGELQRQILEDLGYEFRFLCLNRERALPHKAYRELGSLGSPLPVFRVTSALLMALQSIRSMDKLAGYLRENSCFAERPEEMRAVYAGFLKDLGQVDSLLKVSSLSRASWEKLRKIPQARGQKPLRVGIVGDLYTVMEPFANYDLERRLIERGVSVSRQMSVSFLLFPPSKGRKIRAAGGYLRRPVGANGIDSVGQSLRYAKAGYDGILHIKAFGCAPELNAVPALMNIRRDFDIPVMHMSFDTHSSEIGIETRLEAFLDMIAMRRRRDGERLQSGGGHRVHFHKGSHTR